LDHISRNPYGELKQAILKEVEDFLYENAQMKVTEEELIFTKAPEELGDYALALHKLCKKYNLPVSDISEAVAKLIPSRVSLVSTAAHKGGYVNFRLDFKEYGYLVLDSIKTLGTEYGYVPADKAMRILVEYISANPIHPLHVGHLRNAVLGESLARILERRGHIVRRHFYVDDVGLQVAYAALGYKLIKGKVNWRKYWKKGDHFIGYIYAATNILVSIIDKRRELELAKKEGDEEKVLEVTRELDDLLYYANSLREKNEEVFELLLDELSKIDDPTNVIVELNRKFERGDPEAERLFRELCNIVIEGFKETLDKLNISFDSWDWESEVTLRSNRTRSVLEKLSETPFIEKRMGALYFKGEEMVNSYNLKKVFGLSESFEIPPLALSRSDGTTLYTVRDIAYSIWKFEECNVDKVINVVGVDQKIPQLYLKLALWLLGYKKEAENLHHFAYEMVRLQGVRMSSRRGVMVTADELINEAIARALEEVNKRNPKLEDEEKRRVAERVGIGALKYLLLSTSPSKTIVFSWERAFDLNQNSGPFIQYAYVRASSILRKAHKIPSIIEKDSLVFEDVLERSLLKMIGEFPQVVVEASENMRPDMIASYANEFAKLFNLFYEKCPVLKASGPHYHTRLLLVHATSIVLKNSLEMLGIDVPRKM